MKPLLHAPRPTDEIPPFVWWLNRRERRFGAALARVTMGAHRGDAELMLQAQEIARFGPAAIQLHGIDCRGWMCDELVWLDVQNDEGQV